MKPTSEKWTASLSMRAPTNNSYKRTVLSSLERGGNIRAFKIGSSKTGHIGPALAANVNSAFIRLRKARGYKVMPFRRQFWGRKAWCAN